MDGFNWGGTWFLIEGSLFNRKQRCEHPIFARFLKFDNLEFANLNAILIQMSHLPSTKELDHTWWNISTRVLLFVVWFLCLFCFFLYQSSSFGRPVVAWKHVSWHVATNLRTGLRSFPCLLWAGSTDFCSNPFVSPIPCFVKLLSLIWILLPALWCLFCELW